MTLAPSDPAWQRSWAPRPDRTVPAQRPAPAPAAEPAAPTAAAPPAPAASLHESSREPAARLAGRATVLPARPARRTAGGAWARAVSRLPWPGSPARRRRTR